MAASPWLLSGVLLIGITAVLAALYLYQQPRGLTPTEARAILRDRDIDVVIDVRTDEEWGSGHYPNAVHLPLRDLPRRLPITVPDRDTRILFYCRIGRRSAQAARIASDLGYRRVTYLAGGDYTDLEPTPHVHPN